MATTLLLVDDHPLFRQGLHLLLDKQQDLRVVGEAEDGQTAIELARDLSPDVVVMDITMPNLDGIEATKRILAESPQAKIVALSIHAEKQFVENMLGVGAAGYILKESVPEELVNGIRTVAAGQIFLSGTITDVVVAHYMGLVSGEETLAPVDETSSNQIIITKLHRPPRAPNLVPRRRLVKYLNQRRQRPLTLISAGAGYGKSTLISNWMDTIDSPTAWLSLDERDDDLVSFLTYFVTAVQTIFPNVGQETLSLVQAAIPPPLPVLAASLINELARIETSFILVLDDYHLIRELAIHDLLNELLHHPPPLMHLVIIARRDPPLALANLRARGQVTEFGDQDLRFTVAETAAFLQLYTEARVEEADASVLEQRTEGWVTGLRLSALSLRHGDDLGRLLRSLPENIHYVTDYLMSEVLSRQPVAVQEFLLKTSILNRFCAPLADMVYASGTEGTDESEVNSQAILEQLDQDNLFIIPLDNQRRWFRYHHLFQVLLQQRLHQTLMPESIARLHRRAGEWFESRHLPTESIEYALAAGEFVQAAEIVEKHRHEQHDKAEWHVVERWLADLPEELKQQRPGLLLAEAWIVYIRFQLEKLPSLIEQAEALLDDQTATPSLLGELNFFQGMFLYWLGEAETSIRHLEEALTQVSEKDLHVRCNIDLMLALAHHMDDRKSLAIQALSERIQTIDPSQSISMAFLLAGMSFIHLLSGGLSQLNTQTQQMQSLTLGRGNDNTDAWSWYLLAMTHLHACELDEAASHFVEAARYRYALDTRAVIDNLAGLALSQQLTQLSDDASKTMDQLLALAQELGSDPNNMAVARSCQARLYLLQGRLHEAIRWARSVDETPTLPGLFVWLEVPAITQARVLIAAEDEESLRKATDLLKAIRHQGEKYHFTNQVIEAVVLQSLALEKQNHSNEALATLQEAVTLAKPGGWIRPFVEAGTLMANLLNQLRQQGVASAYIDQILAAFPKKNEGEESVLSEVEGMKDESDQVLLHPSPLAGPGITSQPLIEPLTDRELDVLELLGQRLSDKEIAQQLVISTQTVKKHNARIFQKLNVKNRREAVAKATELDLLSP